MNKKDWKYITMTVFIIGIYSLFISIVYILATKEPLGSIFLVSTFMMMAIIVGKFWLERRKISYPENDSKLGYYSPGSMQPFILGFSIAAMFFLFTFNIWFFIYAIPIFLYVIKNFFKGAKH